MKCLELGCKGHPSITFERDCTYTVKCAVCKREIKGHSTEAAAWKAFLSKYQQGMLTPAEGDAWRRKVMGIDRPEPPA